MSEGEHTTHKVEVEYTATDHASGTAQKISHAFHESGHAVEGLKEKFKEFRHESFALAAGVFGVGFGMGSLIEKTSEAIREFGGVQKAIAGTLSTVLQWPKTLDPVDKFKRSMVLSKNVTEELDETAGKFGMGLQDLGAAYRTVAVSAAPLKLTQEEVLELAVKSAAAAKQFGIDASTAADQIGRTLVTKTVRAGGDLGKFLFQNLGNKMKGLSNEKVFEKMNKTLTQSVGIAEQMGQGMGGSIARIHIRVQEMFREIGGPLFKAIATSLDGISKKLGEVGKDGRSMLQVYGQKLVDAFTKMKEAAAFIADHWKTIAVVMAGIKLPAAMQMLAGLAGGGVGGIAGLGGVFKNVGSAFGAMMGGGGASGIVGFISALGPATAAIVGIGGAAALAAMALKGIYDEWQGRKQQAAGLGEFFKQMGEINKTENLIKKHSANLSSGQIDYMRSKQDEAAGTALKFLDQKGLLKDNRLDMEKFNGVVAAMADDVREQFQKALGATGFQGPMSSGALGAFASELLSRHMNNQVFAQALSPDDTQRKTGGVVQNFLGDIHLTQKFEDVDPDRVFLRFKDDLESLAHRPTSSPLSTPIGD